MPTFHKKFILSKLPWDGLNQFKEKKGCSKLRDYLIKIHTRHPLHNTRSGLIYARHWIGSHLRTPYKHLSPKERAMLMPQLLQVKLCENWLLWNFTEEQNKSSIPSLSAPTTLNLCPMKNHITPASLSWAYGLSHGNLHSQLAISKYENHPNSHKSILGSCTKRKKKNPNPNHPLWIYLNNLRVVLITDQFPSKLPQKWILLPSYTEPTVSQQCGISLHPKPHCHEKPIWKPLKSSSFSPIGPYTMHFNLSTFDRENTKPSTQHTFMILGHSSLTKITN